MTIRLIAGDKVKLLPQPELFKLLKQRNFCSDDETRTRISKEIGGMKGLVYSIEDQWAFDYFYFCREESDPGVYGNRYSIPYESVTEVLQKA